MKIMPYLGVCYMIAGFASLGLPGLSGFVAEMTIFFGAFENASLFHRVFVIAATTSIVITAVYILRVVGKLILGPVHDEHHLQLTDASWWERLSTVTLILCLAGIGFFPNWINETIQQSFVPIINALNLAAV